MFYSNKKKVALMDDLFIKLIISTDCLARKVIFSQTRQIATVLLHKKAAPHRRLICYKNNFSTYSKWLTSQQQMEVRP